MKKIQFPKLGIFFTTSKATGNSNNSNGNGNGCVIYRKNTKDMLLDSLLVGAIVFVSSLPSTGIPTLDNLYSAIRGFLYYFLAQLIVDRVTANIEKQIKKSERGNK